MPKPPKETKKTVNVIRHEPKILQIEIEPAILKSIMSTFSNAKIERFFVRSYNKKMILGGKGENISIVIFTLEHESIVGEFSGFIKVDTFVDYISTIKSKIVSLTFKDKLNISGDRITHKISYSEITPEDSDLIETIEHFDDNISYDKANIYSIDASNFSDIISVGSKLSFMKTVQFDSNEGKLKASYSQDNSVDGSEIEIPCETKQIGDVSYATISPRFIKSFEIFKNKFDLYLTDISPVKAYQEYTAGEKSYKMSVKIMIAGIVESGETDENIEIPIDNIDTVIEIDDKEYEDENITDEDIDDLSDEIIFEDEDIE